MTWYVFGCRKCKTPASIRPAETRSGKKPTKFKCLVCEKTTTVKHPLFRSDNYEDAQEFVRKKKASFAV